MARQTFGLGIADWAFTRDTGTGVISAVGGTTITFFNAETGGIQYTDLIDESGQPTDHVITSDGNDGRAVSTIPPLQGPDGVWIMWASSDGGPRQLLFSAEALAALGPLTDSINAAFNAHLGATNPHGTTFHSLADVSTTAPTDGQVPVYDTTTELWTPETVSGLTAGQFVATAGGSSILIPEGDVTTRALQIWLPSGSRASAPNTLSVWWNAGTSGTPNWQEITRLNEYGELRLQPSATSRVMLRLKQFSGAQSANLTEWTDYSNNILSSVDAVGRIRSPNLGLMPTWTQETATVGTGTYRIYNHTGTALVLRGFAASCGGDGPTGADLIVDPRLDGVALYASENRPTITAGSQYSGLATALSTAAWPSGSYLSVDVAQVGSTQAGTRLVIQGLAY